MVLAEDLRKLDDTVDALLRCEMRGALMASGPGGGARDPKNTRKLQRDTKTFNAYFNAQRYGGVSGAFESGKVDNIYSLYQAGGTSWMVLVLELWPRQSVVDWAKKQVAAHP